MPEYKKHIWPDLDKEVAGPESNLPLGLLGVEDYDRARLCVAYCKGIPNDVLAAIVDLNEKLPIRSALIRDQAG